MDARAAVLTGRGSAALATIRVTGPQASQALAALLTVAPPAPGRTAVGHVRTDEGLIDQVLVGHEAPRDLCLHTHGNPLIVERIMTHLQAIGVSLVSASDLEAAVARDSLEAEAAAALVSTRTLLGARLVAQQRDHGLVPRLRQWLAAPPALEALHAACGDMLARAPAARAALRGLTVCLVGPPNSGKSTLFNGLLGTERALVADHHGTTRDWIDADLTLPDLHLRLLDTPGLGPLNVADPTGLDRRAQDRVTRLLAGVDLVLLVLDRSRDAGQLRDLPWEHCDPRRTLVLANKSDLPRRLAPEALDLLPREHAFNARQEADRIDLIDRLRALAGVTELDITPPTPFMPRQIAGLRRLAALSDPAALRPLLRDLVHGPLAPEPDDVFP